MEYQNARKRYREIKRLDGWFSEEAALLLAFLDSLQKQNQIEGDLFEIGVHHGKSALYLHRFLAEGEQLRVCDLFGEQEKNISHSGSGDKQQFLDNYAKLTDGGNIAVFEKFSNELSVEEIGTNYRMFHVDGGHSCT